VEATHTRRHLDALDRAAPVRIRPGGAGLSRLHYHFIHPGATEGQPSRSANAASASVPPFHSGGGDWSTAWSDSDASGWLAPKTPIGPIGPFQAQRSVDGPGLRSGQSLAAARPRGLSAVDLDFHTARQLAYLSPLSLPLPPPPSPLRKEQIYIVYAAVEKQIQNNKFLITSATRILAHTM
jgi:hypothetical protein